MPSRSVMLSEALSWSYGGAWHGILGSPGGHGFREPNFSKPADDLRFRRYGLSYRDVEELLAEGGITVDQVILYRVGVHWSLGDAGAALHVGRGLHPGQFTTPERRGRLHTDLARAWWQGGKPEQAWISRSRSGGNRKGNRLSR
jgi:hypothetical protein